MQLEGQLCAEMVKSVAEMNHQTSVPVKPWHALKWFLGHTSTHCTACHAWLTLAHTVIDCATTL